MTVSLFDGSTVTAQMHDLYLGCAAAQGSGYYGRAMGLLRVAPVVAAAMVQIIAISRR